MVDKRYGIPFVAALALNLVYWGVVGDWFGQVVRLDAVLHSAHDALPFGFKI